MSNEANLSGFQKDCYFSRAWAMLTQEKGWWKPVALCALASLVPIVGPLAVFGYCLEWARRVAWGSTEAPSRHVKVGQLIKSGWRGAVVFLGWNIVAVFAPRCTRTSRQATAPRPFGRWAPTTRGGFCACG